jgi:hypothetical protein
MSFVLVLDLWHFAGTTDAAGDLWLQHCFDSIKHKLIMVDLLMDKLLGPYMDSSPTKDHTNLHGILWPRNWLGPWRYVHFCEFQ